VDLIWNKPVRVSLKSHAPLRELGITDPYPQLPEIWSATAAEWGWHVSTAASIEPAVVVNLALQLQSYAT